MGLGAGGPLAQSPSKVELTKLERADVSAKNFPDLHIEKGIAFRLAMNGAQEVAGLGVAAEFFEDPDLSEPEGLMIWKERDELLDELQLHRRVPFVAGHSKLGMEPQGSLR